jgi:DNA processing protein
MEWRRIVPGDGEFPEELASLEGEMEVGALWLQGRIPGPPRIAIVGTRKPDLTGIGLARRLAGRAAGRGECVVSGGALGIDSAAHEGALDAGSTLAVLGSAPDRIYPAGNAELFRRIVERQGGLITEQPPGRPSRGHVFLRRNRLVAALSRTVVVVQARHRSGALNTAWWAERMGIRVLAVPGSPLGRLSEGPNRLIEQGKADILTGSNPLLEGAVRDPAGLRGSYRKIADLVSREPTPVQRITAESGLSVSEVLRVLLILELDGIVVRRGAYCYARA